METKSYTPPGIAVFQIHTRHIVCDSLNLGGTDPAFSGYGAEDDWDK